MPPDDVTAAAPSSRAWLGRWLVLLGLWSIPGLVSSTQVYFLQLRYEPITFWQAFVWQSPGWYYWALATPLILWLGSRLHINRTSFYWTVPLHAALAMAMYVPHLLLSIACGRYIGLPYYAETGYYDLTVKLFTRNVHLGFLTYFAVLAAGYALEYYRAFRDRELVASRLETRLAQANLQALKAQLHPHFLFNTLNAIAVLVRKKDTNGAVRTLASLSELLRATLEASGRHTVPVRQELDFLDRYVGIQKTRFGDRLRVEMDVDADSLDVQVPTLILQPLVENSIRHGIEPRAGAGAVTIRVADRDDRLILEVVDDGVGLPASFSQSREGTGLGNVRARLIQLYPDDHRFEVEGVSGGGVRVHIDIPRRVEGITAPVLELEAAQR